MPARRSAPHRGGTRAAFGAVAPRLLVLLLLAMPAARGAAVQRVDPEGGPRRRPFAVRVLGDAPQPRSQRIGATLRRDLGVELVPNPLGARLGIVLVRRPDGRDDAAFTRTWRRWLASHRGLVELPVTSTADGYAVATGRIVVEFNAGVHPDDSRRMLARFGTPIVDGPTSFRPTRFVVEGVSGGHPDPVGLARRIGAEAGVRFAEADLLFVSAARLP